MAWRSAAAVIGGYYIMGLISLVLVGAWRYLGGSTTQGFTGISLLASALAAFVGGYTTAVLARRRQIEHAVGLVAFAIFIAAVSVATAEAGQTWRYQLANVAVMVPGIFVGTYLHKRARR